jgi:hypothetical protein
VKTQFSFYLVHIIIPAITVRYDYNALAALGPAVNYKLNVVNTIFLLPNAIQQVVLPRTSLDNDSIDADTIRTTR